MSECAIITKMAITTTITKMAIAETNSKLAQYFAKPKRNFGFSLHVERSFGNPFISLRVEPLWPQARCCRGKYDGALRTT